jgi:hypothetical protein
MAKAKTQIQKFCETALELEVELTPSRFDDALKRVARNKPSSEAEAPAKAQSHREKR